MELYESGTVKTKSEALKTVGLSSTALWAAEQSPAGTAYVETMTQIVRDRVIDINLLIDKMTRRAVEIVGDLAENAGKDDVRLRAAQDILDRGSRTAKVHKAQVAIAKITDTQAQNLAEALVASAEMRKQMAGQEIGVYDGSQITDFTINDS
jgi:hypothetical protein